MERLLKIIEELPAEEVDKILDFAEYLNAKREKSLSDDSAKASENSPAFWDNDIDDKVWNNV